MPGRPARRAEGPSYKGTARASLRLAAVLLVASTAGGCALSGSFGSLFGKSDGGVRAYADDTTGSIGIPPASASSAGLPSEADLAFARIAVVDLLKRGSKEASAPWENPQSGAHGTVTPLATAYEREGATCRDFLASYMRRQGTETWLQGEACRGKRGAWEVKSLRPWSRS